MSARTTQHLPLEADDVLADPVVDVAGIPIQLAASDRRRAEAVAALFRHAERTSATPRCLLRFMAGDVGCPLVDSGRIVDEVEIWRTEPADLWLRAVEGLTVHASPHEIHIGGDSPDLARVFRFVAFIALTHVLAHHDRQVLHGGAVVVDEQAILVLGETGSGKSTLVFSALQLGWLALSDDMIAAHRDNNQVQAAGLPRPISVPSDVFRVQVSEGRRVPDDPRQRTELPAATLSRGLYPVAAILIPSHGSAANAVMASMRGHETLRAVLSASTSITDVEILPEVFAIAGALARTPAWSFAHAADPSTRVDAAARKLDDLGRHLRGGPAP